MQKDKKNLANLLIKADKLSKSKEIALAEEFITITDTIDELSEKLDTFSEELKKKDYLLEFDKEELRGEKGDNGEDGIDGEDYVLTEQDKKDIAKSIKVPVVEKVIEKIEVIRETPIITNEIKEVAKYESAESLRDKLESLKEENRLDASAIKNLPEFIQNDNRIGFGSMIKEAPKDNKYYARKNREWAEVASPDLSAYVQNTRTLTINGTTYDLSADRSWTISTGTTYTFSTGLTNIAGTITSNLSTGVSGGQSVVGGTSSGNNLTLSSTSNATKGKILFGTSAYDEVNNRLGIGTTTPSELIHLYVPSGNAKQLIEVAGGATTALNLKSGTNVWSLAHQNSFHSGNLLLNFGGTNYTTNALEVTTTGNFGFGTATPSEAIHLYAPSGDRKILSEVAGGATTAFILKGSSTYWNFAMNSVFHSGNLLITNDNTFTTNAIEISTTNRVGIGVAAPSARLHLPAGTATASTAPLKFTSGTNLTTAEAGAFEYDGNSLFFTPKGTLRSGILMTDQTNFNTYTQASKGATAFTSGTHNFLAGYIAGGLLTSGSQNVAIGNYAGYNFSNALGNVAIGYWANRGNASVETTVMIGYQTGYLASGASYSTFIGGAAGYSATNAVYSVFIGHQAGQYMSSGDRTVALGYYAGYSATNAAYSEFVGTQAGYFATNAAHGFFGGYQAGYGATDAANSVFIGQGAGRNATSAVESIFIGKGSGNNAVSTGVTGDYNIGLGTDTGKALTSGVGNTFIGYKVGDTVTTGSKNLLIGYDIDAQSNTADGQLSIQNAIFGTGNSGTGTTASTGKIGIYTVAPTCALDVTGGIATSRTAVTAPAATDGNIFSGTYTPTLTGVTNVASSTAYACQYIRVGNVVTVSGKLDVTATTNNTRTTLGISLPIASNFAATENCGGTGHTLANTTAGHAAAIYADATNDRAELDYYETHGAADTLSFSFTYRII